MALTRRKKIGPTRWGMKLTTTISAVNQVTDHERVTTLRKRAGTRHWVINHLPASRSTELVASRALPNRIGCLQDQCLVEGSQAYRLTTANRLYLQVGTVSGEKDT